MKFGKLSMLMVGCLSLAACVKQIEMRFVKDRTFEYGEKVEVKSLIQETNAKKITYPKLDTMKVGKKTLTFVGDGKEFHLKITIKDTKAPEIILKQESVEIIQGDALNLNDYVSSVKDVVDGEIPFASQQIPHTYIIEGNVDTNTPGTYEAKVIAMDKNKNISEKTLTIIVKEKVVETPPVNSDSSSNSLGSSNSNSGFSNGGGSNLPGFDGSTIRAQIFEQVNIERSKVGVAPLRLDAGALHTVASIRAKEIMTLFDHKRPDGSYFYSLLDQSGIYYMKCGENIASGVGSGYDVMSWWMNSPGHRANILDPEYNTIAIGVYGNYYVQIFTKG